MNERESSGQTQKRDADDLCDVSTRRDVGDLDLGLRGKS